MEDDQMCAELLAGLIRLQGGEAVLCPSIENAREALETNAFSLFVLDYMLPDGTGSAFYYELRERGFLAPAIMLTGLPDLSTAVQLTRSGLYDYLPKPFDANEFMERLRRAVLPTLATPSEEDGSDFVGNSAEALEVRRLAHQAADNPSATVLLTGETGTGKDLTARMIHRLTFPQASSATAFMAVNCSTLPGEMFEAELFGAEKGAYTGAFQQRKGLAEAANGGTLFLDEIGEVPLPLQSKLLQFVETQEFRRLGSVQTLMFTGRVIAATNRSLEAEVKAGRFRSDLWYRLDVFSICLPALREHREDLPLLCEVLLDRLSQKYQRAKPNLNPEDLSTLMTYDFPGNVRELRNLLERSLVQTSREASWLELDRSWLRRARQANSAETSVSSPSPTRQLSTLEAQEYALIQRALQTEGGVIRRAAESLGLSHQSLLRRLDKWPELRPKR